MPIIKLEIKKINVGKGDPTKLTHELSEKMFRHVKDTFEAEGPGWKPLQERTKKQRLRQGFGEGPILDRKRNLGLRSSVITVATQEKAIVGIRAGLNSIIGAVHQFGARIIRVTKPGKVRLRKNKQGKIVFAKKAHKRVTEVNKSFGKRYTIHIPIRRIFNVTTALKNQLAAIAKNFFENTK